MNPGKLNRRIKFISLSSTKNEYGGTTPVQTPEITTWGSLEPIKQYNQMAIEAGATTENGDRILVIRYRASWAPTVNMLFVNESEDDIVYTIKSILPYYPGMNRNSQKSEDKVFQDKEYIYIIGIRTDNSWINQHS